MKWFKHRDCLNRAIVYKRDGIRVVACREHFKIVVDYIRRGLR